MTTQDQASFPTKNANAAFNVASFVHLAVRNLDHIFGQGYALKNPQVVVAVMNATRHEFDRRADQSKQSGTSPPAGGAS
jgi:hypothetical protein